MDERNFRNRAISAFLLLFMGMTSAVFFIIALAIWAATALFDKRLVVLHQFTCLWASMYTIFMPVKIEGREKADPFGTYVITSNHQSQLDILVLFRLFFHFKWVSKSEIFNVPFIGWNMVLNRYVRLKRGDKESVKKMMDDCERTLSEGSSIFMFPEGTRSHDGALRQFKLGAFILAKKMNLPILPVAVSGTIKALPKYSLNFSGKYKIKVKVLDVIEPETFKDMSVEDLALSVRSVIAANVEQ